MFQKADFGSRWQLGLQLSPDVADPGYIHVDILHNFTRPPNPCNLFVHIDLPYKVAKRVCRILQPV